MSKLQTYIIEYRVYLHSGDKYIRKTKVKNCMSELHAKVKLGKWVESKTENLDRIEIFSCTQDLWKDIFGFDIFKGF